MDLQENSPSFCKDILGFPKCNVTMMSNFAENYHAFVKENSLSPQDLPTFSA